MLDLPLDTDTNCRQHFRSKRDACVLNCDGLSMDKDSTKKHRRKAVHQRGRVHQVCIKKWVKYVSSSIGWFWPSMLPQMKTFLINMLLLTWWDCQKLLPVNKCRAFIFQKEWFPARSVMGLRMPIHKRGCKLQLRVSTFYLFLVACYKPHFESHFRPSQQIKVHGGLIKNFKELAVFGNFVRFLVAFWRRCEEICKCSLITGLWQPSVFIATLLFDPSMSALPIILKQNSVSVGLFTH